MYVIGAQCIVIVAFSSMTATLDKEMDDPGERERVWRVTGSEKGTKRVESC